MRKSSSPLMAETPHIAQADEITGKRFARCAEKRTSQNRHNPLKNTTDRRAPRGFYLAIVRSCCLLSPLPTP
jgi:hypothetical protein